MPHATDLSDQQWALIEPMVTGWKQDRVARSATGDPGSCDLREVVNALLYQNRTGCQWRLLPHDLPAWSAVFYYFTLWPQDGLDQRGQEILRCQVRERSRRLENPSLVIIDTQSVRVAAGVPKETTGLDVNKRTPGRGRHEPGHRRGGPRRERARQRACCPSSSDRPATDRSRLPHFRADVRAVHARARPVEFAGRVQLGEQDAVQLLEDPGLLPAVQTPPTGLSRAEPQLQRQELPRDVVIEHVQDALQAQPVIHRTRPWRPLRQGGSSALISAHKSSSTIRGRVLTHHERTDHHTGHAPSAPTPKIALRALRSGPAPGSFHPGKPSSLPLLAAFAQATVVPTSSGPTTGGVRMACPAPGVADGGPISRIPPWTSLYAAEMQPSAPPPSARSGHAAVPAQRSLLTERIARELEHDIRSGDIPVGTKLPSERELATQFGASRNVVREVLRRLEAQHLIEVAPGRGSFVREQTSGQARGYDALYRAGRPTVRQLIAARLPLEVETVRLATEHATDEDIEALRSAGGPLESASDVVVRARADMAFHDAIAEASKNPVLRIMLSSISGMMFEMMLRSNSDPSIGEPGVPHHLEIFEAIEARDADLACERMREHLMLGLRTYGKDLDIPVDIMARNHIEALLDETGNRYGVGRTGA